MQSTQLSLFAAVKKKPSNVPVFLVYAGIIHAIGLALLMPMLITLPGPGSGIAPKTAAVDVEIVADSPSAAKVAQDADETSALPAAQPSAAAHAPVEALPEAGSAEAEAETPGAVANVSPEAQPEGDATPSAKTEAAVPAAAEPAKKPAAQRSKAARPAVRRSVKAPSKITPFNGALSGLFSPGAPANKRR